MKYSPPLTILIAAYMACLFSCHKEENTILVPPTDTNGSLLIWTNKPAAFGPCGPTLLVTLSNGNQSTITNYWPTDPISCSKQFGGYFSLAPGRYSYTITTIGACADFTDFVTVDTGRCKLVELYP